MSSALGIEEGEALDRESVRSSLLALITSDTLPETSDQAPLTHELLGKWQSMAVPEQRYTAFGAISPLTMAYKLGIDRRKLLSNNYK